jgi:acetolactate synthase-1/3 small subunit
MKHTLIALMEDKPGVLNRIAGLFQRRNYNIESLSVGHSEKAGISRMTIVLDGEDRVVDQVVKQLSKLVNVTEVLNVGGRPSVSRELALIKVQASSKTRSEIVELANIFRARIVDVGTTSLTVEITGPEDRVNSLIDLLKPFGVEETARTGRVSMLRSGSNAMAGGDGLDTPQAALQPRPLITQEVSA